jgi:hypothetical protein
MARFRITKDETGRHTWKATGNNPITGRAMTIRGGQTGTPVGKDNPRSEQSFDARHDAQTPMTPKKYINKLRWDNKAKMNTSVNIPDDYFKTPRHKIRTPSYTDRAHRHDPYIKSFSFLID